MKKRIAILASGGGSNFEAVVYACERGSINGDVVLLIYDRRDAFVRERAKNHGIEAVYMNRFQYDKDENRLDSAMLDTLKSHNIDLIVLAGYISKVGKQVVFEYRGSIINTHPALIPSFCGMGMHGEHVHKAVVEYGVKLSGCTIHFVDDGMDTGAVILQAAVPVSYEDTPETVAARVLVEEHKLLPEAVRLYCEDKLVIHGRRVEILK